MNQIDLRRGQAQRQAPPVRAIVIGGSIAGLLSAGVLVKYFSQVTVIERDKLPEQPEPRKGVPQSTQPHILLTRGYRILSELFPNLSTELRQRGALTIDWGQEFYSFGQAGWLAHTSDPSDLISMTCSRPLLEWTIRQQLQKNTQIQFLEEHRVTGLIYHQQEHQIVGVKTRPPRSSDEKRLMAQLVIDCSGRSSQAPQWLKDIGLTPPPQTIVNPHLGYTTRRYREPKNFQAPWKVMLINHIPPEHTRLGYLARIEQGEWIATLGGYEGDCPPIDDKGFLDFARSLRNSSFYEAISNAEPISPIYAHRATVNRLRHYEKIDLPSGFIVLGDAVCSLCPVYGQGMTVSALASLVLQKWLSRSQKFFFSKKLSSSSFQKDLATSNSFHWNIATSQDSRFLKTTGKIHPSFFDSLFKRYTQRLQVQATLNPKVYISFMEIAHSLKSPLYFFSPGLVWQSLKNNSKQIQHK